MNHEVLRYNEFEARPTAVAIRHVEPEPDYIDAEWEELKEADQLASVREALAGMPSLTFITINEVRQEPEEYHGGLLGFFADILIGIGKLGKMENIQKIDGLS